MRTLIVGCGFLMLTGAKAPRIGNHEVILALTGLVVVLSVITTAS